MLCCCCCCCCRTLQQHFRRKAVNLSNVCTLSPYRQTRQLPPSLHCATRQGRHTPRGPTHWTGVFWKTHYALRHFRGEPPYCERGGQGNCFSLCEIFEAMRNQSSDAIPTGTRERQTSLICIFCSFLREEKNKRRKGERKRHKESCVGGRLLEKLTGKAI